MGLNLSESLFTLGFDRIRSASATTIATSPPESFTGGGAALGDDVDDGVGTSEDVAAGDAAGDAGVATGTRVEVGGVDGEAAGTIDRPGANARVDDGADVTVAAGEHAASTATRIGPISRLPLVTG
jgi:hypothetical protein